MNVVDTLSALTSVKEPVHLAIGFFDGVHAGHREVIRPAIEQARKDGGQVWVLTFEEHPLAVLQPGTEPETISSNSFKARLFEDLGVQGCIFEPFTQELANYSPPDFIQLLKDKCPTLTGIYVGENWRFGHRGQGDTALLPSLLENSAVSATVSQSVQSGEHVVSSTLIRHLIRESRFEEASALLGYPYTLTGIVVEGFKQGREIGFPTANIKPDHTLIPPNGVYAVTLDCLGTTHSGVMNIGVRPTLQEAPARTRSIEVHIFDLNQDLYGKSINVQPVSFLREEQRFPDTAALTRQIDHDCHQAREVLATNVH